MSTNHVREIHGVKVKAVKGTWKQGWGVVIDGEDGIAWGANSMKDAFSHAGDFIQGKQKRLKSKAYKAIERDSIVGDKETQAKADIAMNAHLAGTLSVEEYRYWASRQSEFELLNGSTKQ